MTVQLKGFHNQGWESIIDQYVHKKIAIWLSNQVYTGTNVAPHYTVAKGCNVRRVPA